ncbi:MAG: hypothetical protein CEO21_93 [Microgenomates group bacterium Gr01-1014_80]|nr:MAG: hypothetical protein CEO21_93 [Microgenomates group bacterium Gr01-1014_80]
MGRIEVAIQDLITETVTKDPEQHKLAEILYKNFMALKEVGLKDTESEGVSFHSLFGSQSQPEVPQRLRKLLLVRSAILTELNDPVSSAILAELDYPLDSFGPHARFGYLFGALRERRGWSQTQLSRLIHYDQSLISKVERGKRLPADPMLNAICMVFGLKMQESPEQPE